MLIGLLVAAIVGVEIFAVVGRRDPNEISELGGPIVPLDQAAAIFVDVALLTLLLGAIGLVAVAARGEEVSEP